MIRNNQFYALDTIVDFRPLGLFIIERSAVSVDYCRYMAIVELWKILMVCFLPKIILREKTWLNGLILRQNIAQTSGAIVAELLVPPEGSY